MFTPDGPPASSDQADERVSGFADAALAHLHRIYRGDTASLQVAIESSTGEQRRRLQHVLANLRSEQR